MGNLHSNQNLLGFFLIDKPKGVTSFYVVKVLRKILNIKKMGFAGTLDPLASGLMIVAAGEATKLLSGLEGLDKIYEVDIFLGAKSATYDAEGPITLSPQGELMSHNPPSRSQLEKILEDEFLGERMQTPPIYSAIQIEGKRAYALARKGKHVELKKRKVHFFEIKIKHYKWPILTCMVHCSSGTYIRSFANDIGQILGCGGYVKELRRTKVGTYSIKDAVPLQAMADLEFLKNLKRPEDFLSDLLQYNLNDVDYKILASGGFVDNRSPDLKFKLENRMHILAMHRDLCVGVLEFTNSGQLKFAKKFNIVVGD